MKFVRVAAASDIPDEGALKVEPNGHPIALVRFENRVYAVSDICTHEEASLSDGFVEDHVIECPRHGAQYDVRTGEALSFPAMTPLPVYEVKVEGNDVLVRIEETEE